jgi:transposase
MNCRRRRTEEALQVGLRRRSTVHRNVDVDKRQVLALLLGRLLAHSFLSLTKKRGQTKFFDKATVTVDWFHVVQTFTEAVNKVRVLESKQKELPKHTRWATLKNADGTLTENQKEALAELERMDFFTAIAWRVKEKLRWIRKAATPRAATWRLSHFLLNVSSMELHRSPLLQPVIEAIETVIRHRPAIEARWQSQHSTARLEGLNSLFQAARARARGYRNPMTFIAMIYLIASPIGNIINST